MPYIAIKGYPKDRKTKEEIVKRINDAFLEVWGCSQGGDFDFDRRSCSGKMGRDSC